ncbi:MAG: aspartate ammonia-lyase [Veillonellales bacterium]
MRIEQDCLGELQVPADVYYGIQTERAKHNFDVSGHTISELPTFIRSIATIKKAAALANRDIGVLDDQIAGAICQAAEEIIAGKFTEEFPVDIFQGGGSTSTNMNVNEVIANRANEILTGHKGYDSVHPNTHVNMGQSTNDVIPAAMSLTCCIYLKELIDSLRYLEKHLAKKVDEFRLIVKVSRTCIQDAVPITLGQEFSGYLSFIRRHISQFEQIMHSCAELSLGATAVGTGLGAFSGYVSKVYEYLTRLTGIPVKVKANLFDGLQNADPYLQVSGTLKTLATGLGKIATDLRIMSSGPRAGFNEIELPSVQPGSSIMPGKVNPVMPELMNQICYQVCGNDSAISMAVEGGELDLNVWEPLIIKCLSESFKILTRGIFRFTDYCISGIKANEAVCKRNAEYSLAISTVIAALFGYETGTKVAKEAYRTGATVKEVALKMGLFTEEEAETLMDPLTLTDPSKSSEILALCKLK